LLIHLTVLAAECHSPWAKSYY